MSEGLDSAGASDTVVMTLNVVFLLFGEANLAPGCGGVVGGGLGRETTWATATGECWMLPARRRLRWRNRVAESWSMIVSDKWSLISACSLSPL